MPYPPTPSQTASNTPTPSITASVTPTYSPTGTACPVITNTPTISITPSNTPTVSITPSNTPTVSITPSQTPTINVTPTQTPTINLTPTQTQTQTQTQTPTATLCRECDRYANNTFETLEIDYQSCEGVFYVNELIPANETVCIVRGSGGGTDWAEMDLQAPNCNPPCPSPSQTPSQTSTINATPTQTQTNTQTPSVCALDFQVNYICNEATPDSTVIVSGITCGSGQYDINQVLYLTESGATSGIYIQVLSPTVSYYSVENFTWWVCVKDRNNPTNIVCKSITPSCG